MTSVLSPISNFLNNQNVFIVKKLMSIGVETRIEARYRGAMFELSAFKLLVSIQVSSPINQLIISL